MVRELRELGLADAKTRSTGRVGFRGDETAVARANIHLRTAERVLIELARFPAEDFGQLFDGVVDLPWEDWLRIDSAFPVNGRSVKSRLSSVPACQKIVKKAIVERLRRTHSTDWFEETGPECIVEVSLLEDEASITIDTTGTGLHKRGYRRLTAAAPLRETLSAALVLLSFWEPDRPLLDPFCGSGTILVEAAMIGRNIAPGLRRKFDAQHWDFASPEVWEDVRRQAESQMLDRLPQRLIGTDVDADVLSLARFHAERAGVADDIHWQQADFAELQSSRQYGCLITNPPYGQRMGEVDEVEELYRQMPLVLRKLPTWSHYIITAFEQFEDLIGRKADRRRKLYNGRIACTYYQFHGPRPLRSDRSSEAQPEEVAEVETGVQPREPSKPSPTEMPPVFGGLDATAKRQAEEFASRLRKRARHLRRWPTKRGIHCYRLYERDIPEIPLVVDRYEDHLHLAEFERPHDRGPAEHADWLDLMSETAAVTLEVPRGKVFLKHRARKRDTQQYDKASNERHRLIVSEGNLKFEVNLSDYVDTGLFLDHRQTRQMFADRAEGKDVLNLFCYTGAFTVYAAAAGAASTMSVDLSHNYLDWAHRNLRHNHVDGSQHVRLRSDALAFLNRSAPYPTYDLALVDPPTFSNSKTTERDWDIQRDHAELFMHLLPWMRPGGEIFFSTNFRRFKLYEPALKNCQIREITGKTIPEDFRNKRIHRCWVITVGDE